MTTDFKIRKTNDGFKLEELEGPNLEFKEDLTKNFLKTVSAYANGSGGIVLFGVADDGTMTGVKDLESAKLSVENSINDSITPHPSYSLEGWSDYGVVALTIEGGGSPPYLYKSQAYVRHDTASTPVDERELKRLVLKGEHLTFDKVPSTKKDLSFHVLEETLKRELGLESFSSDTLRTFGLMTREGEFTNAGALIADTNPFPGIDVVEFGETISIIRYRQTFAGMSILKQMKSAVEQFEARYAYEAIEQFTRNRKERIPADAFREAIANALAHREWDRLANISVAMYADRVEVTSPGGLPEDMTEDMYLNRMVSELRNPVIASLFFRIGYIEKLGTGIARIREAYEGTGTAPQFHLGPKCIVVVLPVKPDEMPSDSSQAARGLNAHYAVRTQGPEISELTPDERSVYEATQSSAPLTRRQIEDRTGFRKDKVLGILRSLGRTGLIESTGKGRATRYSRK